MDTLWNAPVLREVVDAANRGVTEPSSLVRESDVRAIFSPEPLDALLTEVDWLSRNGVPLANRYLNVKFGFDDEREFPPLPEEAKAGEATLIATLDGWEIWRCPRYVSAVPMYESRCAGPAIFWFTDEL